MGFKSRDPSAHSTVPLWPIHLEDTLYNYRQQGQPIIYIQKTQTTYVYTFPTQSHALSDSIISLIASVLKDQEVSIIQAVN
jgi:hypothetical protein